MALINLHAHSEFSDGIHSITIMAAESKRLGHCALVITDHCYSNFEGSVLKFSMTEQSYEKSRIEANAIARLSDYPVIIGMELSIRDYEEVVVLGESAVQDILRLRDEKDNIDLSDLKHIKEEHECLINLCHPFIKNSFLNEDGTESFLIDGYEIINGRRKMFQGKDNPYAKLNLTRLANSDAHGAEHLGTCCNEVSEDLRSEKDIIQYFKQKRKVTPLINSRFQTTKNHWVNKIQFT